MLRTSPLTFISLCLLSFTFFSLGLHSIASAQVVAGAQVGSPGSAANVGAEVTRTEVDKQKPYSTESDPAGVTPLPNRPVGSCRPEMKAPGFKDYVQTGIGLVVNNSIQINDRSICP
jgi:hypothetical protein